MKQISLTVRLISLALALSLLVVILPQHIDAVDNSTYSQTTLSSEYLEKYYFFIQNQDFHVTGNQSNGGPLCRRNRQTGQVDILLSGNVTDLALASDRVFVIIDQGELGYVEIQTGDYYTLFKRQGLWRLLSFPSKLFYAIEQSVYSYNLDSSNEEHIATFVSMETYLPLNNRYISWVKTGEEFYVRDLQDNIDLQFNTYEQSLAYCRDATAIPEDIQESISRAARIASSAVGFPLPDYPIGSFFTDDHEYCGHHDDGICDFNEEACNCRYYSGSIQCAAFAKYAVDRYAHLSESQGDYIRQYNDAHDIIDEDTGVGGERFYTSLAQAPRGSYVRVSRNASSCFSGHSFVVVTNYPSEQKMTIYECNLYDNCQVTSRTVSYSELAKSYYMYFISFHEFSTAPTYYDQWSHRIPCSLPDCSGYVLEAHTSGSVCLICQ